VIEGRQATHEERGCADDDDRDLQQVLASVAVAEVGEDDAAQGTGDEADGVGGEGGDDADSGVVVLREEDLAEHQGGCSGVEEEFVPFDDGSGHRGGNHAVEPALRGGVRRVGGQRRWGVIVGSVLLDGHVHLLSGSRFAGGISGE